MSALEKTISLLQEMPEDKVNIIYAYVQMMSNVKDAKSAQDCKAHNMEKLDKIAALQNDWNGYGAEPLSPQVIEKTRSLIQGLVIQPEIFPTAAGSIQMEYEKDNGDYLEFQISDNSQWSAYMILRGKETEMLIQPTLEDVNKAVGAFNE